MKKILKNLLRVTVMMLVANGVILAASESARTATMNFNSVSKTGGKLIGVADAYSDNTFSITTHDISGWRDVNNLNTRTTEGFENKIDTFRMYGGNRFLPYSVDPVENYISFATGFGSIFAEK